MASQGVSNRLLYGMGAGGFLSMLAVAYLLGRDAGRRDCPVYYPAPMASPSPAAAAAAPQQPPAWPSAPAWTPPPATGSGAPAPAPGLTPQALAQAQMAVAEAEAQQDRSDSPRDDIYFYFEKMDGLNPGAGGMDPNSFAQDLLRTALQGDASGFNELIAQTREAELAARGMVPPAACQQYHSDSVQVLQDSRELLEDVRDATVKGDTRALGDITKRARALKARAKKLEDQAAKIKQQYRVN